MASIFAGAVWAQTPQNGTKPNETPVLPKDLPPFGPPVPVKFPPVQIAKLSNGMAVWMVRRTDVPKVAFSLVIRGGYSADPSTLPGVSDLLASSVNQGTKTRTSRQIAEAAERAGGDLSFTVLPDAIFGTLAVLSGAATDGVSLLADVAQNATFPDDEVAIAKSNLLNTLAAQEAHPFFLARRAWSRVVYGDHPYHIIAASTATVQAANSPDLRRLYAATFRPDRVLLIAVGDFNPTTLESAVHRAFDGWRASGAAQESAGPPGISEQHKIFFVDRPQSVQTTLLIGAESPSLRDPDYPAMEVANAIYGGMFGSRLVKNIREVKGYTYSPYSYTSTHRYGAAFLTREDVRNAVTGPSLKETNYELRRMGQAPPSTQEMTTAKRYYIGNSAISLQSQEAVARQLAEYWSEDMPPDTLDREITGVQKATAADIQRIAAKYMNPQRMTVIAVGERSVIEQQLKPFGIPIVPAPPP